MSNGLPDPGQQGAGDDFKEQVRVRSDIAAVIGESISLKALRGGGELAGLCPFHDDRNPSLKVYPDRQTFRCWSCDTGGDVFSFVMKYDGLDFYSALKHLAQRAGLEMPRASQYGGAGARPQSGGPDRGRLLEVLAWADKQCHTLLTRGPEAAAAREYLADRGIHADLAKTYGLGYHPPSWTWLVDRAKGLFDRDELIAAGVAGVKKDGSGLRDHPLFPGRVIFPIRDERGRTIAFGGRQLPGDDFGGKYINSSEGVLFHKSKVLYGLDVAREAIRKPTCDTALVVEGYTDALALHHAGYQNVVATLGTALTKEHVGVLRRFTNRIVLVLDGDRAGQDAAEKALQKLLAESVDLRVLTLPAGTDPADFVSAESQYGPEEFGRRIAAAPEALDFKLGRVTARHGGDALQAGDAATKEMLDLLRTDPGLAGTRRGDLVLMRTSERFGVPERRLRADLKGGKPDPRRSEPPPEASRRPSEPPIAKPAGDQLAEAELLKILLTRPALFAAVHAVVGSADLRHPSLRRLFELCEDANEIDGEVTLPAVLNAAAPRGDSPLKRFAVALLADADAQRIGDRLADGGGDSGTRRAAFSPDGLAAGAATTAPTQARDGVSQDAHSQDARFQDGRGAGVPDLLARTLSAITRRRTARQARSSRADLAHARAAPGGGLDDATRALLRRQADLHAARHAGPS